MGGKKVNRYVWCTPAIDGRVYFTLSLSKQNLCVGQSETTALINPILVRNRCDSSLISVKI